MILAQVDRKPIMARVDRSPAMATERQRILSLGVHLHRPMTEKNSNDILEPDYQYTRLHIAAMLGDLKAVERLLALGANVNSLDFAGNTPLVCCIDNALILPSAQRASIVRQLLKGQTNLNLYSSGCSPLSMAVFNAAADITRLLLVYRAKVQSGHRVFPNAFNTAVKWKLDNIISLFERNGYCLEKRTPKIQFSDVALVETENGAIKTAFTFSNGAKIFSTLLNTHQLTVSQREDCYTLFTSIFTMLGASVDTRAVFEAELPPEKNHLNMFINLIQDAAGTILGFTTFDIKRLSYQGENRLVANLNISVTTPALRGLRLMSFLTFYPPFIMKRLCPDMPLDVFYVSVAPASYCYARRFNPYPLYGSEAYRAYVAAMLENSYAQFGEKPRYQVREHGLVVDEAMTVKGTSKNMPPTCSLLEEDYYRLVSEGPYDERTGTVIAFPVDAERESTFSQMTPGLSSEGVAGYLSKFSSIFVQNPRYSGSIPAGHTPGASHAKCF